jgi:hypothetical protein
MLTGFVESQWTIVANGKWPLAAITFFISNRLQMLRFDTFGNKKWPSFTGSFYIQSGWQDLNLRPHDPQPCTLPDCATSRI